MDILRGHIIYHTSQAPEGPLHLPTGHATLIHSMEACPQPDLSFLGAWHNLTFSSSRGWLTEVTAQGENCMGFHTQLCQFPLPTPPVRLSICLIKLVLKARSLTVWLRPESLGEVCDMHKCFSSRTSQIWDAVLNSLFYFIFFAFLFPITSPQIFYKSRGPKEGKIQNGNNWKSPF